MFIYVGRGAESEVRGRELLPVCLRSQWAPLCHATPEFIRNKLQQVSTALVLMNPVDPHTPAPEAFAEIVAARRHTLTQHTCSAAAESQQEKWNNMLRKLRKEMVQHATSFKTWTF